MAVMASHMNGPITIPLRTRELVLCTWYLQASQSFSLHHCPCVTLEQSGGSSSHPSITPSSYSILRWSEASPERSSLPPSICVVLSSFLSAFLSPTLCTQCWASFSLLVSMHLTFFPELLTGQLTSKEQVVGSGVKWCRDGAGRFNEMTPGNPKEEEEVRESTVP